MIQANPDVQTCAILDRDDFVQEMFDNVRKRITKDFSGSIKITLNVREGRPVESYTTTIEEQVYIPRD